MRSHEADVKKMNRNLWRKLKGSCEQNEKKSEICDGGND